MAAFRIALVAFFLLSTDWVHASEPQSWTLSGSGNTSASVRFSEPATLDLSSLSPDDTQPYSGLVVVSERGGGLIGGRVQAPALSAPSSVGVASLDFPGGRILQLTPGRYRFLLIGSGHTSVRFAVAGSDSRAIVARGREVAWARTATTSLATLRFALPAGDYNGAILATTSEYRAAQARYMEFCVTSAIVCAGIDQGEGGTLLAYTDPGAVTSDAPMIYSSSAQFKVQAGRNAVYQVAGAGQPGSLFAFALLID